MPIEYQVPAVFLLTYLRYFLLSEIDCIDVKLTILLLEPSKTLTTISIKVAASIKIE